MQGSVGSGQFSFSRRGDLVYVPGGDPERMLAFVDRQGVARDLPLPPGAYLAPRVSPDGRRIVIWVSGANCHALVHDIARGATTRLSPGKPQLLFQGPFLNAGDLPALSGSRQYDVTPDGRALLMVKPSEKELAAAPIQFVVNWFEELKRLVPARR